MGGLRERTFCDRSLTCGVRPTNSRLWDLAPQKRHAHWPVVKFTSLKQERNPPQIWQRVASRVTTCGEVS